MSIISVLSKINNLHICLAYRYWVSDQIRRVPHRKSFLETPKFNVIEIADANIRTCHEECYLHLLRDGSTTFDCHWKSMESWVGTRNVIWSRLQYTNSFKEVFSVQGAWNSPNTLPTIFNDHAFRMIAWQPPPTIQAPPNNHPAARWSALWAGALEVSRALCVCLVVFCFFYQTVLIHMILSLILWFWKLLWRSRKRATTQDGRQVIPICRLCFMLSI